MNTIKWIACAVLMTITLILPGNGHSAYWGVTTGEGLQYALNQAANNGEDDLIEIDAIWGLLFLGPFEYVSDENYSLRIKNVGSGKPYIIQASNIQKPGLRIEVTNPANVDAHISISGIGFEFNENHKQDEIHHGGGLYVQTGGTINVDKCSFAENDASAGDGAYLISSGGSIYLYENSFYMNNDPHLSAIYSVSSGVLYARAKDWISITNSTFEENGGLAANLETDGRIRIINSDFGNNTFGLRAVAQGGISLQTSKFHGNGGGVEISTPAGIAYLYLNEFTSNGVPIYNPPYVYACTPGNQYQYCANPGGAQVHARYLIFLENSFEGNEGIQAPGGAYLMGYNNLYIKNNTFEHNHSLLGKGGGLQTGHLASATLANNEFKNNRACSGGAGLMSYGANPDGTINLTKNTFNHNHMHCSEPPGLAPTGSEPPGGGASIITDGTANLTNNIFVENTNIRYLSAGGGAYVDAATATLTNNTFADNYTYSFTSSIGMGAGLFIIPGTKTSLYNNIFWKNGLADRLCGEGPWEDIHMYLLPRNDLMEIDLFNNAFNVLNIFDFGVSNFYTISEGNNIVTDPLLAENYCLCPYSPAIDAADNSYVPSDLTTDFEGDPRIIDGDENGTATVDMGADEYSLVGFSQNSFIVDNYLDIIFSELPTANGSLGEGTMNFFFQEPNDRMPRFWGSRSLGTEVGPGERMTFPIAWPLSNMTPSQSARIFINFETTIADTSGGKFPVLAFADRWTPEEKPETAPLLELTATGNTMTATAFLFGFASPGTPVGSIRFHARVPNWVSVDIKPGSCPNPVNVKTKGVLPVAVLGTADLDVTTIDPATIRLSREGISGGVAPLRWSYEDMGTPFAGEMCDCHDLNGDGYLDLSLKFDTQAVVTTLKLEEVRGLTLPLIATGKLKEEAGGTEIKGQDCIRVLK